MSIKHELKRYDPGRTFLTPVLGSATAHDRPSKVCVISADLFNGPYKLPA